MSSGDELGRRLRTTFLHELSEQVRVLNDGLLALERRERGQEIVPTLFRSAHTIKGAARVADVPEIERACHVLEAVFAELRDGRRTLAGADISTLFAVFDALEEAGDLLRRGHGLQGSTLQALLPRLEAMTAAAGTESAPRAAVVADAAPVEGRRAEDLVRVSGSRLDGLLSTVGELVIATGRILERSGSRDDDARRLDRITAELADAVHGLRMRPFAEIAEGLPRAVRDIAAAEGKRVKLELSGQDVEADRIVSDALREPLLHLVRNAVDHGIETPAERRERGKPAEGVIRVGAELAGGRLVITVSDDGAGIDEPAVREALSQRGVAPPRTHADLADALLGGGFSTRREATTISGRGVGLDLVRSAVQRIGGALDVTWTPGAGTTFTVECPPRPAMIRALLVRVGAHMLAIPTASVERLRRLHGDELQSAEGQSLMPTRSGPVTVHSLAALLGPPLETHPVEGLATLVVIRVGARRAAFIVDEVVAEDEIVVRPIDAEPGAVPYASGAAVLPSGSVTLVLGPAALLGGGARAGTAIAPAFAEPRPALRARVLVADDSITTRTLEQGVLEAAGYDVATAVDGQDAWQQLERDGADLVVADIEMPRMDGFALCRRIRASPRFAELPIVLVTGLASDEDRARGMDAGADAYIVKSSFDQAGLVQTVRQLVGDNDPGTDRR
jgi:two-component system, chemotaxis family, sensor kinase CheA